MTDANLVLGQINAQRPIGGKLTALDVTASRQAIDAKISGPLALSTEDAAEAILRVANAKMAGAIRLVSIERGHDPAKFHAMPFGGGGALHAGALIRECDLHGAMVPRFPGVTSALGCIVADMRYDHVKTIKQLLTNVDCLALESDLRAVASDLQERLAEANVEFVETETRFELDMLYVGQTHTIVAALPLPADGLSRTDIAEAFAVAYRARFGRLLDSIAMRIMNYRVTSIGKRPPFDMRVLGPDQAKPANDCVLGQRDIYHDGQWHTVPVYDRLTIAVDEVLQGACLLEQPDSTVFIDLGLQGHVDDHWNLVIDRPGGG